MSQQRNETTVALAGLQSFVSVSGMDLDFDNASDDGMSVASVPPSPTFTDQDFDPKNDQRSISPSSAWSMTSSLQEAAFREEYGRKLNNHSEIYSMPADDEELGRLDLQHSLLIEATGSKYAPPMVEALTPRYEGDVKACLDLGCGSGSWITDVARDFPLAEVVGIDLVPVHIKDLPDNCRVEVDDINLGLEHFYGSFDVVHVRFLCSGIRDYKHLVNDIANVLRPGGLVDLQETDYYIYDHNFQKYEFATDTVDLRPPWWPRFLTVVSEATKALGGDPDAASHLYDWVKQHPGFEDVRYREYWVPSSPWQQTHGLTTKPQIDALQDSLGYVESARPVLLRRGHPEQLVDILISKTQEELREAKIPCYARLLCVHARKVTPQVTQAPRV